MKIPLYRQIQANLKEKITSGVYEEGGLLPSENDLCTEFNATRMTVRQALNELVREGYANDLVRAIQDQRKELDLAYTDRIVIGVVADDPEVTAAIKEHQAFIAGETLCDALSFAAIDGATEVGSELGNGNVRMWVKKK